ncbi:MAG: 3-keto-5-aminohexanoate cleavage protein [Xanthomonadales bacterium]|nr:3-keto-5-aminohexanoate cleavage protein [Xanthomonadales bacterium]
MNRTPFITCAVTGAGDSPSRSPHVPVTPKDIAAAAIDAAKAGAAIAHIHVRDPETGAGSRDSKLFREVVDRVRDSDTDVAINLTCGMGGDLFLGPDEDLLNFTEGTDCVGQEERMRHVVECLPEICSLDCGSFNYISDHYVYVSTADLLRRGARLARELGVKPELEVFDLGQAWFARQLVKEGLINDPPLLQMCMGIPWGIEATPENFLALRNNLPENAIFAGFALGAKSLPWVALSVLMGGNVRVGLEDNLYLAKGVPATNAQLVERAVNIVENMGGSVLGPQATRELLGLRKQTP